MEEGEEEKGEKEWNQMIPATGEAEAGGFLELRSSRLAGAAQ